MDSDFWIKKWKDGETRFHNDKYHHLLVKHASLFTKGTILVPLCGKSLDMLFLTSLGHKVIGVELSPIACKDFFIENKISYRECTKGEFTVYESEQITLWCGDFFNLPAEVWTQVTGIYDRAALIALPPEIRKKYVEEVSQQTNSTIEVLLITLEYNDASISGPPFSVDEAEVRSHYKEFISKKIFIDNDEKLSLGNPKFKSASLKEIVYWLTKKH